VRAAGAPTIEKPVRQSGHGAPSDEAAPHRRRRRGGRAGGKNKQVGSSKPAPKPQAIAPLSEAFRELGVDETGLEAIAALGYQTPTPIQAEALPLMLEGNDLVGLAQTGTGKTLAFGLPLARAIDRDVLEVHALVLVPTRELAAQVCEVIAHLGKFYGFKTIGIIGGSRMKSDLTALERGGLVVVGTPGRVIDHLKRGTLSLRAVRFAILDEADQMLDIGFARDIDYILRTVPKDRQTGLFSATMPESIGRLVYRYLRNAERVAIDPDHRTADGVEQYYCEVSERDKFLALRYLFENQGLGKCLIFRRTRVGVDRLAAQLNACGVQARAIHGDLRQGQRNRVMQDFKSGNLDMLVATNVAARGLDIPDISEVINYDIPQNAEEYIHRIGRTARAGKQGRAFTLVGEWDMKEWDALTREVGAERLNYVEMPARWD
jgi:ATP-dependent RNA helicase DeaD